MELAKLSIALHVCTPAVRCMFVVFKNPVSSRNPGCCLQTNNHCTCLKTLFNLASRIWLAQVRFSQDERVYKAFLEILNMYRKGQKTIVQVYEEVRCTRGFSIAVSVITCKLMGNNINRRICWRRETSELCCARLVGCKKTERPLTHASRPS